MTKKNDKFCQLITLQVTDPRLLLTKIFPTTAPPTAETNPDTAVSNNENMTNPIAAHVTSELRWPENLIPVCQEST
jgi:hypothetical protein